MSIATSRNVQHAALYADEMCGSGTRYIFYMKIGEVLSRPFTPQDTHTVHGDLIVAFTSSDRVDKQTARRVMGTTALLGFASPCFTYGSDLLLPSEINGKLRAVLRANQELTVRHRGDVARNRREEGKGLDNFDAFRYLASVARKNRQDVSIYIPEVCVRLRCASIVAAVLYRAPRRARSLIHGLRPWARWCRFYSRLG